MIKIESFPFEKKYFDQIKNYHFGLNWPVVYMQENDKEMYIGQSTSAYGRSMQHIENPARARLRRIHIITDEEFNLSAAFDIESKLIQYIAAEGRYKLQNGNGGLVNHNYYDREKYLAKLNTAWTALKALGIVDKSLEEIKNSEFFKYSPYKALTEDQLIVANQIERAIKKGEAKTHIVNGGPGTGKSVLGLYLLKKLSDAYAAEGLNIALVVPMTGLRTTLQRVIRRVPGMRADMIIGPSDVAKKKYDILLVDEAHRLRRRVNLSNFKSYDDTNKLLKLPKEATQLDWILLQSKQQVLFYDKGQSVVPGDIRPEFLKQLDAKHYELTSQLRVEGGDDYLKFVDQLLSMQDASSNRPDSYDFKLFANLEEMINQIKLKDSEHSLSRVVAGYAWPWRTKGGKEGHDIEIGDLKLVWNSTNIDWINSPNSLNEVGCIHTIQGYDLNYTGVIIGPEVSYDAVHDCLVIDEKKYMDINGKRSISNPKELQGYILNIYKTLLTRGIKGTYVYIVDDVLRARMKELAG